MGIVKRAGQAAIGLMAWALATGCAARPAAQEPESGLELFRSMESKLMSAKTLRFDFRIASDGSWFEIVGSVALGSDNRVRLDARYTFADGSKCHVEVVANGTRLATRQEDGPWTRGTADAGLRDDILEFIIYGELLWVFTAP